MRCEKHLELNAVIERVAIELRVASWRVEEEMDGRVDGRKEIPAQSNRLEIHGITIEVAVQRQINENEVVTR